MVSLFLNNANILNGKKKIYIFFFKITDCPRENKPIKVHLKRKSKQIQIDLFGKNKCIYFL